MFEDLENNPGYTQKKEEKKHHRIESPTYTKRLRRFNTSVFFTYDI